MCGLRLVNPFLKGSIMSTRSEEKVGLDHLDDACLQSIVDGAAGEHGGELKRWPRIAEIAFEELARRSGYEIE